MSSVSFYERRPRSTHTECKMLTVLWPEESGALTWHRSGSGRPRAGGPGEGPVQEAEALTPRTWG